MLRDYQLKAIEQVRASWASQHTRIILCLPTGAGKSMIFTTMAKLAANNGKNVLILTHRKELKKQAIGYGDTFRVEMVETFNNSVKRGIDLHRLDLVIIDEAHIGNFRKILEQLPDQVFVIGATATPMSKPPMNKYYSDIIEPISISELISTGYLATPRTFQKQVDELDYSALEIRSGEFTTKSLQGQFSKPRKFNGVAQDYLEKGNGRKAIVFCCSIEHSEQVFHAFDMITPLAFLVHSKMMPKERDQVMSNFINSPIGVLVNCGIATTGFDCPDIELVIVNRATMSLPLWMQMCGRGSRVIPGKKTEFEIWDYGDNVARLGHWEQRINWKQIFAEPEKIRNAKGAEFLKQCEKCAAFISTHVRICPYCSCEIATKPSQILDGNLVEIPYIDVADLNGRMLFDLDPLNLALYIKFKKLKKVYFELVLHFSGRDYILHQYWNDRGYKFGYKIKRTEFFKKFPDGIKNVRVKL